MTAGVLLINELFPPEFRFKDEIISGAVLYERLAKFAKAKPSLYAKNISKIARLGEKMAFSLGSSVGIDDLVVDTKKVNKLMDGLEEKVNKAKTKEQKVDILLDGFNKAVNLSGSITHEGNQLKEQINAGARGKPEQLARLTVGPVYSIDSSQVPKPALIRNSFNTGLTSNEYFNVSSQGRFSSVTSANATSEPGALGKDLIASGDTEKIVEDCGTMNGEYMSVKSKKPIGFYEAGPKGKLITAKYLSSITAKFIKVRTPIICQAKVGVCQKCYGINAMGKVPEIGTEVGILAGQTVSQITTQRVLAVKHSVKGKKKGGDELSGTKGISILTNAPSSYQNYMVISDTSGILSSIKKEIDGTTSVKVGGKRFSIPKNAKLTKKVGDYVNKGDKLTGNGALNSKDVLEHRGTYEGRRALSDGINNLFRESIGIRLDSKHFDVLARGQMSVYQDKLGNLVGRSQIKKKYTTPPQTSRVGSPILGKYIGEDTALFEEGTLITDRVLAKLKLFDIKMVKVQNTKPKYKPVFKGMTSRSSANSSHEQAMNYRGIKESFLNNVNSVRRKDVIPFGHSSRALFAAGEL